MTDCKPSQSTKIASRKWAIPWHEIATALESDSWFSDDSNTELVVILVAQVNTDQLQQCLLVKVKELDDGN
jgi:hypothetical protein